MLSENQHGCSCVYNTSKLPHYMNSRRSTDNGDGLCETLLNTSRAQIIFQSPKFEYAMTTNDKGK